MSLLLEALKKAELAKQGKKPAADDAAASAIPFERAPLERPSAAQPVITRGQLPDISQPLEILSEDLPSASANRAIQEAQPVAAAPVDMSLVPASPVTVAPMAMAPMAMPPMTMPPPAAPIAPHHPLRTEEPEIEPQSSAANAAPAESAGAAERDAARQLFEAKEVEYNPKRNFHITIGVLLAAGAGYGGYVWWQLQPKTAYSAAAVQSAAKSAPAAPQTAQADQTPAPQPPAAGADAAQAPASAAPGTAAAKSAIPAPAPAAPAGIQPGAPQPTGPAFAKSTVGPVAAARPSDRPAARSGAQEPAKGEQSPIAITPPALAVDPLVERAFESYQRGDLAGARDAYLQVLQREPLNRDALLGMAAIDVRSRSFDAAGARYIKLLELDPRDVDAQTGLMALRGQVDPAQSESRLKTLIATNPDSAQLHFALGNLYAQQARWADAQAAFFKAYSGDSENADFAYNLAVSLDQLRQKSPALQYYQRAIALAANRPVSFEPAQVTIRIQELQRQ